MGVSSECGDPTWPQTARNSAESAQSIAASAVPRRKRCVASGLKRASRWRAAARAAAGW